MTTNVEECEPCPIFASFTLEFASQLRKNHSKTSVRVRKTSVRLGKTSFRVHISKTPLIPPHTHTHTLQTTSVQIETVTSVGFSFLMLKGCTVQKAYNI
jgi:hypothetical protein